MDNNGNIKISLREFQSDSHYPAVHLPKYMWRQLEYIPILYPLAEVEANLYRPNYKDGIEYNRCQRWI